jgi:hypothetical protein
MLEKLKVVAIDRITSFDTPSDERAQKLALEIQHDGKLKNPLLVSPLDDKFLLLDDSSIVLALESLEVTHVPVQLANPKTISVYPWQRVVDGVTKDDVLLFCAVFPRQLRVHENPKGTPGRHQAEIKFADDARLRISLLSRSPLVRADVCAKFYAGFNRAHKTFRVKLDYADPHPLHKFPGASAAIFPPLFSLEDLAAIAQHDIRLPRGVVRIDQPERLLGIDYALSVLKENASSEEKEAFLVQLLQLRMSSDRIAYYNGSVFMFNN